MQFTCHFVEWQGERYTIQQLKSASRVTTLSPVWAVFHRVSSLERWLINRMKPPRRSRTVVSTGCKTC